MIAIAVCAIVALVLMTIGALAVIRENHRLERRVEVLMQSPLLGPEPRRLARALERIGNNVDEMHVLIERAGRAFATIRGALKELRLPEALVALRVALAAIRALVTSV